MKIKSFKQFLLETNTQWQLEPSLNSNDYIIDNNFNNVKSWQAKVFTEGAVKEGAMDQVGYVMFNITNHTYIPIAREDEHHSGYDHIIKNLHKKQKDWYPIYMLGHHFIYEGSEARALELLRSLKDNGYKLKNLKVQPINSKIVITADKFLATGKLEHVAGELSDDGEELIRKLKAITKQANDIRNDPMLDKKIKGFRSNALSLIKWFNKLYPNELLYANSFWKDIDGYVKQLEAFPEDDNLLKNIELVLFGFKGFKNKIHLMLKDNKLKERTDSFFGDSNLAKGIFDGF